MTTTEPTTMTVELLDPAELVTHPRNVRAALGDLDGLTASIASQGVLEPLVVVPFAGRHVIVAGHRRAAAAIMAGLQRVPCIVRADISSDSESDADTAAEIAAMLAENLHRENLTAAEEARGIQAMLDLGVSVSLVAKSTGLGRKRVAKAAGVARLDDESLRLVTDSQLSLDQAAAVALFADDGEAIAKLTQAGKDGPGAFAHALERVKQDRELQQRYRDRLAELEAAGRTVVDSWARSGGKNRDLAALKHGRKYLTAETHASCPGSAVYLGLQWGELYEYEVCTDFAKHGHVDAWASGSSPSSSKAETPAEKEAASAERRKVIENNKAMAAANTVRRAWVREYLARSSAPKTVLRFAVEEIAANPDAVHTWVGSDSPYGDKDADEALGIQTPRLPWSSSGTQKRSTLTSGESVPDARLPLQLLAHIAGAIETQIQKDSWRVGDGRRDHLVRWLRFLAAEGYPLADVEQQILDGAAK